MVSIFIDFMHNPRLQEEPVFREIAKIQQLREQASFRPENSGEIETRLNIFRQQFFPDAMHAIQLGQLVSLGRAHVPGGIPKQGFFDTNPPNWLMPSWSKRVKSEQLLANQHQIRDVLQRLRQIHLNTEVRTEIVQEISTRRMHGGKERG